MLSFIVHINSACDSVLHSSWKHCSNVGHFLFPFSDYTFSTCLLFVFPKEVLRLGLPAH